MKSENPEPPAAPHKCKKVVAITEMRCHVIQPLSDDEITELRQIVVKLRKLYRPGGCPVALRVFDEDR